MTSTDWLLDWVETGTVATGTVTLYGNATAVKKYADLEAKLKELEKADDDGETLSSGSAANRVRAEMERIAEDELVPSGTVWTLRALDDEEIRDISDSLDFPAPPVEPTIPRKSGNPAAKADYEVAMEKYRRDSVTFLEQTAAKTDERNLLFIQTAFVQAESPRGVQESVSIEGLKALRRRPHGQLQVQMLIDKITELTTQPLDITVPKSQTPSENTQD